MLHEKDEYEINNPEENCEVKIPFKWSESKGMYVRTKKFVTDHSH